MRGFEPVRVELIKAVEEAPGIKSFYFLYNKSGLEYRASQVFHLHLDPDVDQDAYRAFSIASSPTEDFLLFTMRMRPESIYKQRLEMTRPGDTLAVVGPVGMFVLPADPSKHVVFLGDGIGITPFRSMAKFATDRLLSNRITLIYSNRKPEDIIFRREWDKLSQQNPNLRVIHTMTRPEDSSEKWTGIVGKIDERMIHENVSDIGNAIFYLCGTPSKVREFLGLLRRIGVNTNRIMVDAFFGYD